LRQAPIPKARALLSASFSSPPIAVLEAFLIISEKKTPIVKNSFEPDEFFISQMLRLLK